MVRSQFLPSVRIFASAGHESDELIYNDLVGSGQTTITQPHEVGATISTNIFNGFGSLNQLRASNFEIKVAKNQLKNNINQYIYSVIALIYRVRIAKDQIDQVKTNLMMAKRTKSVIQKKLKANFLARSDLDLIDAQINLLNINLVDATNNLALAKSAFINKTGFTIPSHIVFKPINPDLLPSSMAQLQSRVGLYNAQIVADQAGVIAKST